MSLNEYFPKTKFVKTFDFKRQLDVVLGELVEVEEAYNNNTNINEEIIDVMHSTMQLFYILGLKEDDVSKVVDFVKDKNFRRGYYIEDRK